MRQQAVKPPLNQVTVMRAVRMTACMTFFAALITVQTSAGEPVKLLALGGDWLNAAKPACFPKLAESAGRQWTLTEGAKPGQPLSGINEATARTLFAGDLNALMIEANLSAPLDGDTGEIATATRMIRNFLALHPGASVFVLQSPPPLSEAARTAKLDRRIRFPVEAERYRDAFEFERVWLGRRAQDTQGRAVAWRHRSYQLFDAVAASFPELKKQNRIHLVPVGDVYDKLHRKMAEGLVKGIGNIGAFYADEIRQKDGLAAYTVAATIYATLFGADPKPLDHSIYDRSADQGVVDLIERTIWHEVRWNPRAARNLNQPKPEMAHPTRAWPSVELTALLDVPLRDPSILLADDGQYYLTGTVGSKTKNQDGESSALDFQNNPGIRLWRSKNMRDWVDLGEVWNMRKQALQGPKLDLAAFPQLRPDQSGKLAHGVTKPEIHKAKGNYWICFSVNDYGTALLRSKTGKPEGPYENWTQISIDGTDPSMFEDDDGKVYWIMNDGRIARLTDDLKGFAEAPRQLMPKADQSPFSKNFQQDYDPARYLSRPLTPCDGGGYMTKRNGKYIFFGYRKTMRYFSWCMDTHVMCADSIYGPYTDMHLMISHGGQATYFEDADGMPYAAFSGSDEHSVLRDQAGIIPLKWLEWDDWEVHSVAQGLNYPRKPHHVFTQKGIWSAMKPVPLDEQIRDCTIFTAPDGEVFIGGSLCSRPFELIFWRSRDMVNWTEWHPDADIASLELEKQDDFNQRLWSCELKYFSGTFWITVHRLTSAGATLYRSKTGKVDGPYELLGNIGRHFNDDPNVGVAANVFEGVDGKLYANNQIKWQLKVAEADLNAKDWTGLGPWKYRPIECEPWPNVSVDYWGAVDVMEGKYIHVAHAAGCGGGRLGYYPIYMLSYDVAVLTGETPWGPFRHPQIIPHMAGGWSGKLAKDKNGRWWGILFGDNYHAPWFMRMGLIPLVVKERDGTLNIRVAEHSELTDTEKEVISVNNN